MRAALLTRLKRLETVRVVEESNRPFKVEFAYLKLLPREYSALATSSQWASVLTGGMTTKNGPAHRRPIEARSTTRT